MLEVHNISKSFGPVQALDNVSFTVKAGDVLAVLGPSGCGKSTLLSIIAGLTPADSGDVLWDDESIQEQPTHQRNFGLMFQDYALFPHLSAGDNVGFGLKGNDKAQVSELLDRVGLKGFERRDVQTLSGGEAQRVALARALAPRPRLLMLDEPLGALDRALREQLTGELRSLLRGFGQTTIYVTHDQQEAFGISDQVLIMQAGRVAQMGPTDEVYRRPANEFVQKFLGPGKLIEGRVTEAATIRTPVGEWPMTGNGLAAQPGEEVVILLRAEGVRKR